ncbi:MAG: cupredoxin domain-containing protein [Chloroflexi bacterium]|nr:cupredoxin domain-containing protein [Chloroflexota bacterium]
MGSFKRFLPLGVLAIGGLIAFLLVPALAAAQTQQEVRVTFDEFTISPAAISISQGEPVRFTAVNVGKAPHNITVVFEAQGISKTLFDTNLQPGETRSTEFTFSAAGDWVMYCPVSNHKDRGMIGAIQVLAASAAPASQPTPAVVPTPVPAQPLSASGPTALPWIIGLVVVALLGAGFWIWRRQP